MSCKNNYLPSEIDLNLFSGDIQSYTDTLYKIFHRDFIEQTITYNNKPVDIIHEKYYNGKERSFWHLISDGDEDINRTPHSTRAQFLPFVKPIITDTNKCTSLKKWIKYYEKTKHYRHFIWCTDVDFIVVLEDRGSYYKLITAFHVNSHAKKSYEKSYNNYIKSFL